MCKKKTEQTVIGEKGERSEVESNRSTVNCWCEHTNSPLSLPPIEKCLDSTCVSSSHSVFCSPPSRSRKNHNNSRRDKKLRKMGRKERQRKCETRDFLGGESTIRKFPLRDWPSRVGFLGIPFEAVSKGRRLISCGATSGQYRERIVLCNSN